MYPAMLNITNKWVTIIGGGKVAYRKVHGFLVFGAKIRVISPIFYEKFESLSQQVDLLQREYTNEDLEESFLVIAATNNKGVNEQIGTYCHTCRILCNVIDNIHLSSFIVPAYMKQGDLVISISTNGKSPSLASKIKKELSEQYNNSYEEYVDILGRIRDKVIARYEDEEEKKEILHFIITLSLEELRNYEKSYFGY